MGICGCNCIPEVLAVGRIECVLELQSFLLLELLFVSAVEGKEMSRLEVLIS